ncbi:serine hydrolase domain-containing protein [Arthrobacter oryzae]|uniref:serine hydrolase domain-containing protein n=1 Tax=Arthrobacter oryzae TaxID=409290 RepID=UPI00267EE22C
MIARTPVLLASSSKSLTAIAVMQQVEAGRLRLNEPVQTYLPWFTLDDSRSSAITVRHLLHQANGMASKDRPSKTPTRRARKPSNKASGPWQNPRWPANRAPPSTTPAPTSTSWASWCRRSPASRSTTT